MINMSLKEKEIYNFLRELNCCKICCVRYLGHRNGQIYTDIKNHLNKYDLEKSSEEPLSKYTKENVCVCCLDLLHERTTDDILRQIESSKIMEMYDNPNIVCALSIPISLNLRAFSVWLMLLNKFPNYFSKTVQPEVPIKETWKFIFGPKLVEKFGVTLATSGSILTVELEFENEDDELEKIYKIKPQLFNNRRNEPKKYSSMITRKFFDTNFTPEHISYDEFIANCKQPLSIPNSPLKIKRVTILGDTIFIAGRYNKYSRTLCQTPWIIDGKRISESSVQEIVQEPIIKLFRSDKNLIRLISSGREDVDVRCLGLGRPFVLELPDVQRCNITFSDLRNIEKEINQNKDLQVRDLQLVKREELSHIKTGEEMKTKQYRALCIYTGSASLSSAMINTLNKPDGFLIQQKTPIRVLHRRSLITRPRKIHSMKATLVKDHANLFYLDLITQAGTYIKELVHGDFGRTVPNVKHFLMDYLKEKNTENALKINVDIIALDVTAVNLDWPPRILIENEIEEK